MKDPNSILVVQVNATDGYVFNTIMSEMFGLHVSKDFKMSSLGYIVSDGIFFSDSPQLLIMDRLSDTHQNFQDYINELKRRYPQLVMVQYVASTFKKDVVGFDREINAGNPGSMQDVYQAIKDFEAGKLRRKVPDPVPVQA